MDLLPRLADAAGTTFLITVVSVPASAAVALAVGILGLSRRRALRTLSLLYIEFFRGTSLLVQVFAFFFVLPLVGISLDAALVGPLVISLHFGAYGAEVVKASVRAIDPGQWDASIALNMPWSLAMRRIVLPQAARRMLPPFGNMAIEILKATPLLSVIAVQELALTGRVLRQETGRTTDVYVVTLFIYFALALPLVLITRRLERRWGAQSPVQRNV